MDRDGGVTVAELMRALAPHTSCELAAPLDVTAAAGMIISGVTLDSRRVRPGDAFVALRGSRHDGHDFIDDARGRGAVLVISDKSGADPADTGVAPLPVLLVGYGRRALAIAADLAAGSPTSRLMMIGVTGTDGKTTTCGLVQAMLSHAGIQAGLVTTTETIVGGERDAVLHRMTTPEADVLHPLFARMVRAGDRAAVMEVTSHGLVQDRVYGIAFQGAILTNVGTDHLELHKSHEAYRAAKRMLFERLVGRDGEPAVAAIPVDDPFGPEFAAAARASGARVVTFGISAAADVRAGEVKVGPSGSDFVVSSGGTRQAVLLPLEGSFNVINALAAYALATNLGVTPELASEALGTVRPARGRMQRLETDTPFEVVIDFAKTAEGLESVLAYLAPQARARGGGVLTVIGSAGDRYAGKRATMGRVAASGSRVVVLANEDPRTEDPMQILEDMAVGAEAAGLSRGRDLFLVPDREEAIRTAVGRAREGDIVLVAGKGHEATLELATGPMAWDDAAAALRAVEGWGGAPRRTAPGD